MGARAPGQYAIFPHRILAKGNCCEIAMLQEFYIAVGILSAP
jgi:hypothetical protein